jgi:hypothetical protein
MTSLEIVNKYYSLNTDVRTGKAQLQDLRNLLADSMVFIGPLMKIEGADNYIGLLTNFIPFHEDLKILKQFQSENEICTITNLKLKSPKGNIISMDIAEYMLVENEKIVNHTLYYDPREFQAAFPM